MSGETLLALASEVEAASAPDRRLDYAIMTATVLTGHAYLWDPNDQSHRYTASLDAAMTLVPEQYSFGVEAYSPDHNTLGWTVHLLFDANLKKPDISAFAPTFPLALCAAALRARAHHETSNDG